jgi:hypothetical protein
LRRATIVEKWWCGKVKKETKKSEVLWKEIGSRGTDERKKEELRKVRRQERLASLRLHQREAQRERSPQVGGQEEECVEAREDEAGLDLAEDREDSSPISGNIRNQAEKVAPEEENETPQIKETHPEVSGTSPESPIPQVPSIPMVRSIPHTYAISIPSHSVSQSQSVSVNTGRILGSPGISQPGSLGFILIGTVRPRMAGNMGGSITRYP